MKEKKLLNLVEILLKFTKEFRVVELLWEVAAWKDAALESLMRKMLGLIVLMMKSKSLSLEITCVVIWKDATTRILQKMLIKLIRKEKDLDINNTIFIIKLKKNLFVLI